MDDLLDRIRQAAGQVGEGRFLELLRWHRVVASLPDLDTTARGAYRDAVAELGEARAAELLRDLRNAVRNPRRYRHGADGKPRYRRGKTLGGAARGELSG
ncbi:MAG: hypothetical protein V7706_17720 [Dietzia psychralcaliphila]